MQRIDTITISRDAVGEYWISFSLGSEKPFCQPMPKTGREHGIDLNLIDLVNTSEGTAAPNKKFYAKSQAARAKQQHIQSRRLEHLVLITKYRHPVIQGDLQNLSTRLNRHLPGRYVSASVSS